MVSIETATVVEVEEAVEVVVAEVATATEVCVFFINEST